MAGPLDASGFTLYKNRPNSEGIDMPFKLRDLKAWFLVSGCIGIIVALVLAGVASNRSLNPMLLITLWPTSIVGLAEPMTLSAKILIGVFEFGGNFLLYGVIGTIFGLAFRVVNRAK